MKTKVSIAVMSIVAGLAVPSAILHAQVTLFTEGFEGAFPGIWLVGAQGPTQVYWKDVNGVFGGAGTHSGAWKAYCAGVGYGGTETSPTYQNNMAAYMARTVGLAGYTGAELRFWYNIPSIESCCDSVRVSIDTNYFAWSNAAPTLEWTEARINLDAFVGTTHTLFFHFYSDASVVQEGCYLDDIELVAYTPPGNDWCDGAIPLADDVPYTMETGGQLREKAHPPARLILGRGFGSRSRRRRTARCGSEPAGAASTQCCKYTRGHASSALR